MKKVLIYSIQPEHVLNFLKGRKTAEIRKRDLPQWVKDKLQRGEVVEGYGYCTKGGKRLLYEKQPKHPYYILSNSDGVNSGNGKVVFKFQVSGSDRYFTDIHGSYHHMFHHIGTQACLSQSQITQYGNGADLYAHHFTNITPIEPMGIGEFYGKKKTDIEELDFISKYQVGNNKYQYYRITKSPQSFMTAWVKA